MTTPPPLSHCSALAELQARAALIGWKLAILDPDAVDDGFLLTRWNLSRELPDLEAVRAFLHRVSGGCHG